MSCNALRSRLLRRIENDLLDLHLVEEVICLHSLAQRHDLLGHEARQRLISMDAVKEPRAVAAKNIPEKVLLSLQDFQCLREDRSDRTSTHLDAQVLVIGIVSVPWDLFSLAVFQQPQRRLQNIPLRYEHQHC